MAEVTANAVDGTEEDYTGTLEVESTGEKAAKKKKVVKGLWTKADAVTYLVESH